MRTQIEIQVTEGKSTGELSGVNNSVRVFVDRDFHYGYWIAELALFEMLTSAQRVAYLANDDVVLQVTLAVANAIMDKGCSPYPKQQLLPAIKVYPVIHYENDEQAIFNASLARAQGCAGAFLIDMTGYQEAAMLKCAAALKELFPDFALGMNRMGHHPSDDYMLNRCVGMDMTWTDKCVTHSVSPSVPSQQFWKENLTPEHPLFAGVAFKYQPDEPNPVLAAQTAAALGIIPTTSGPATGKPANLEKLKAIRAGLPSGAPLAVASGVSAENIESLKGIVTHVLVASSILEPGGSERFSPEKLKSLMAVANG